MTEEYLGGPEGEPDKTYCCPECEHFRIYRINDQCWCSECGEKFDEPDVRKKNKGGGDRGASSAHNQATYSDLELEDVGLEPFPPEDP